MSRVNYDMSTVSRDGHVSKNPELAPKNILKMTLSICQVGITVKTQCRALHF